MDPPDGKDKDNELLSEEELGGRLLQQFQFALSASSTESEEEATIIRDTIHHNDDVMNSIYGQWANAGNCDNNNNSNAMALLPPHRPPLPPSRQQRLRLDPPALLAKARTVITSRSGGDTIKKNTRSRLLYPSQNRQQNPQQQYRLRSNSTNAATNNPSSSELHPLQLSFLHKQQRQRVIILCALLLIGMAMLLFWGEIASRMESALLLGPTIVTSSSSSSSTNSTTSTSSSSASELIPSFASSDNNNQHHYIGFHDPSYENIYGANHYYKPPGVGYFVRPIGGLHPVYMTMTNTALVNNDDDDNDGNNSTATSEWDNSEYYNADYESSPYADLRLQLTDEERAQEQTEWRIKLQEIRDRYGYWDFNDDYNNNEVDDGHRPVVDWLTIGNMKKGEYNPLLGEIDKEDFPIGSWQTDDQYITKFIIEGRKLIQRVQSAIHEEYGWNEAEENGEMGGIQLVVDADQSTITLGGKNTVAWMYQSSFKALAKKLLNSMMTNDHFFVTLGGHSAAAGHGK